MAEASPNRLISDQGLDSLLVGLDLPLARRDDISIHRE